MDIFDIHLSLLMVFMQLIHLIHTSEKEDDSMCQLLGNKIESEDSSPRLN